MRFPRLYMSIEISLLATDLAHQYGRCGEEIFVAGTIPLSEELNDRVMKNAVMVLDHQILPVLQSIIPSFDPKRWNITVAISANGIVLALLRSD